MRLSLLVVLILSACAMAAGIDVVPKPMQGGGNRTDDSWSSEFECGGEAAGPFFGPFVPHHYNRRPT